MKALAKSRKKNLKKFGLRFDEKTAFEVFSAVGEWWREKRGFYAKLVPPHLFYLPEELKHDAKRRCEWLFFMAIPMRGGINSDDAFRFMRGLFSCYPEMFDPCLVQNKTAEELAEAVRDTASRVHNGGSKGAKKAGTMSFKLEEHMGAWIENAKRLVKFWRGDIRNVFKDVKDFEEAFARADYERSEAGFLGMRRKIFSLLTLWLQDFRDIHQFSMPLIVDFHTIRMLLQHRIALASYSRLGPNDTENPLRFRPESLWEYPAVRLKDKFVDTIIMWSQDFLKRKKLVPYDVAHGLWYLSRTLCASYQGNRSKDKRLEGRRTITEFLVDAEELARGIGWPKNYRDPCRFCPVERTCKVAIPSGPYFDWGVMAKAGRHVRYPFRQKRFEGVSWRTMPGSFRSSKHRHVVWTNVNGNGHERKEEISFQYDLGLSGGT